MGVGAFNPVFASTDNDTQPTDAGDSQGDVVGEQESGSEGEHVEDAGENDLIRQLKSKAGEAEAKQKDATKEKIKFQEGAKKAELRKMAAARAAAGNAAKKEKMRIASELLSSGKSLTQIASECDATHKSKHAKAGKKAAKRPQAKQPGVKQIKFVSQETKQKREILKRKMDEIEERAKETSKRAKEEMCKLQKQLKQSAPDTATISVAEEDLAVLGTQEYLTESQMEY